MPCTRSRPTSRALLPGRATAFACNRHRRFSLDAASRTYASNVPEYDISLVVEPTPGFGVSKDAFAGALAAAVGIRDPAAKWDTDGKVELIHMIGKMSAPDLFLAVAALERELPAAFRAAGISRDSSVNELTVTVVRD